MDEECCRAGMNFKFQKYGFLCMKIFQVLCIVLGQLPPREIVPRIIVPPMIAPRSIASEDNCPRAKLPPGQLPPRTKALKDNCPQGKLPPPPRTIALEDNCPQGKLPPRKLPSCHKISLKNNCPHSNKFLSKSTASVLRKTMACVRVISF